MADMYFARRSFGYGRHGLLSRGQVVELIGPADHPGNERLIRLGYLMPHDVQREAYQCAECGKRFIGLAERTAHGKDEHTTRDLSPMEEDARLAKQERMLERVAPLNLEKTVASTGVNTSTEIRVPETTITPGQVVTRPKSARVVGTSR